MKQKSVALITGATSGIGKATAAALAKLKYDLIINGRREALLEKLKKEMEKKYKIKVLASTFDIRKKNDVKTACHSISKTFNHVDILVNNAGLALGLEPFDEGNPDDWDSMLDTNVKGLLYMTKFSLPLLLKSKNPLIINIGSIAGKETYPMGHVYCATKHAVDSITKAMRIDLLSKGVKVTQVCPGATETEFSIVRFKGDEQRAKNTYKGFKPLTPEDIAHIISFIATLPPHVNINDILIMPAQQASAGIIKKDI
ncbi:MAG: NADP-dependent 3-hydroxy acid dehydrogenase YdfG [Bacteroidetes bacterium ADurb.Bin408]|nr:MAG: NADP-dependent 3-hydroxy acid dehydrogenase YdfG [Bacteroidetes bacterium ADurb.Bin408]